MIIGRVIAGRGLEMKIEAGPKPGETSKLITTFGDCWTGRMSAERMALAKSKADPTVKTVVGAPAGAADSKRRSSSGSVFRLKRRVRSGRCRARENQIERRFVGLRPGMTFLLDDGFADRGGGLPALPPTKSTNARPTGQKNFSLRRRGDFSGEG
jgi:hypothetical protein